MNKFIEVLRVMVGTPDAISHVIKADNKDEYFFIYKDKYKWSVSHRDGEYWVYYYVSDESVEELAAIDDWSDSENYAVYSGKKLGGEAKELMAKLHSDLKDRRFNLNAVFDDIIQSASTK